MNNELFRSLFIFAESLQEGQYRGKTASMAAKIWPAAAINRLWGNLALSRWGD
jgi:hypothetical protein